MSKKRKKERKEGKKEREEDYLKRRISLHRFWLLHPCIPIPFCRILFENNNNRIIIRLFCTYCNIGRLGKDADAITICGVYLVSDRT